MEFDAVILAGGRSSRLGGTPKAALRFRGDTLLERSLLAAAGARSVAVVGPEAGALPAGVLLCREDPPFAGPAAALAAGLEALAGGGAAGRNPAPLTLVLACDMPLVADAVHALFADRSRAQPGSEGSVAVSADGRIQPLAGLYDTAALQRSVADAARHGTLVGGSLFGLLASLDLRTVPVPPGSTDDVDTWADAQALGVACPGVAGNGSGRPHTT